METRTLTISDVVNAITSSVECCAPNYQGTDAWQEIKPGLEHLRALSAARGLGLPDPPLPVDEWNARGDAELSRQDAHTDSQMVLNPNSLRRCDIAELHALAVWTADGRVVGIWSHPDPMWVDAKETQIRGMGEGLGWVFERAAYRKAWTHGGG